MPENINWDAVWQSIVDTWLPLVPGVGVVIVGLIVFALVRKKRRK